MRLFKRRRTNPAPSEIDLDRDSIPLGDESDATSLMFEVTMLSRTGVMVNHSADDNQWHVQAADREWRGATQMEALLKAKTDLSA